MSFARHWFVSTTFAALALTATAFLPDRVPSSTGGAAVARGSYVSMTDAVTAALSRVPPERNADKFWRRP